MRLRVLGILLAPLLLPGVAGAATVSLDPCSNCATYVRVVAAPGEVNRIKVSGSRSAVDVIDAGAPLVAGPGCFAAAPGVVRCGGPDFVNIDGGEGGTGAAPLAFSDHVAMPFKLGFARVYPHFVEAGLADGIVFVGAGRLGFPEQALFAFALGCDMVNVGREAMMAIGCIQAQRCHTGTCPTGVATQSKWLMRGLDPELKGARTANYVRALRAEMLSLSRTCGVPHPGLIQPSGLEIVSERFSSTTVEEVFGYDPAWRRPSPEREAELRGLIGASPPRSGPGTEAGPIPGDDAGAGLEREAAIAPASGAGGLATAGD